MRARAWFVAVAAVVSTMLMSTMPKLNARSASGVVISEYRFRGPNGQNDEFIELFNNSSAPVNISGWLVRASTGAGTMSPRVTIPTSTVLAPGCFYLITNIGSFGYSGSVPGNLNYVGQFFDDGGVALTTSVATDIVDQVGQGPLSVGYGEGTRLPIFNTSINRGIERSPGGLLGHVDTDDNAADFRQITPGNPQNAASRCLSPLTVTASATPSPAEQGQPLHVFGRVFPSVSPVSTGITVAGDLSAVGGAPVTPFTDDGAGPDLVAGDDIFTAVVNVPLTNPVGPRSITVTASDAQGRTNSNTISIVVNPPTAMMLPHEVQGAGAMSPIASGRRATVRGVVTARSFNGFFIQTEPGAEDADLATSEGLFVYLNGPSPASAALGHIVHVTGSVSELVPAIDTGSPSVTALDNIEAIFDFGAGNMPAAKELTSDELSADGAFDQLERFEGMRVHVASLMAVSGTGGVRDEANAGSVSDGAFFAVLNGQARPFREPGIEAGYVVPPCASGDCNIPLFDGNPERLRVDSDALENTVALNVATGAVIDNVTGPLDFSSRTYTILPETTPAASAGMSASAAPAAGADRFTVASVHLDRFYDASGDPENELVLSAGAFQRRLDKASAAVRDALGAPDIIGVQDVENLAALAALAQAIDDDAIANGQSAPHYSAHLFEGSADDGLDVGFLVKTANGRVTVLSVEPVPGATQSRPPAVLRATIAGPSSMLPQPITVIVNQMSSRAGIEGDAAVRAARQAEAEFLAGYIETLQANPSEAIVSLGDYNAFSFNDGYVDVVNTVAGSPATGDQVAVETQDLVNRDLVNLLPPDAAERYSSAANGNAQALEHVLVNANLSPLFVVRPRINADFPDVFRNDASPVRMADRDPVVVYFAFPADDVAPAFQNLPADRTVEATSSQGAAVTYTPPTADDNLDGAVAVSCNPSSGSVFALGNSGVTCSAQDAAGNESTTSFTVSVVDTTAPVLTIAAPITVEAQSAAGATVSFAATATDKVTAAPAVSCALSSGVFPLGATTVSCTATDDAGNTSSAAFTVTVQDTIAPTLTLPGNITGEAASSEGLAVTFTATAIDAVAGSPAVDCTPASGSTFAVGETVVTCAAADAAGNVATGTFMVAITSTSTPPVFGHIAGVGAVLDGDQRVWFAFDVKAQATYERGWVTLQLRSGSGRPDRYLSATVTGVQMSDSPDYTPGRSKTGLDTVVFAGTGSWNGVAGHRYEISASDRGEPGRGRDTFSVKVFSPAGVLVESVSGVLRDGNIRALR